MRETIIVAGRTFLAVMRGSAMLRKTIYATLILILTMGAASAQTNKRDQRDQTDQPGLPGYTNVLRSNADRKNDKEIDRAYESTIKGRPDAKQNSDPWADVRPAPPSTAKNKQK